MKSTSGNPTENILFEPLNLANRSFLNFALHTRAIAGFGFFERFASLPAWLAWDCFGEMNGAPDFDSMIDRIASLRGEDGRAIRTGNFQIGCILLSAPVFFNKDEWVTPPNNWAKTGIQKGKTYELNTGEGRRVYRDCLERAQQGEHYWNIEPATNIIREGAERYGKPVSIKPRLGQGLFSLAVREAYNGACAVTHEHSGPVLEAAHIKPYKKGGEHRVDNGLLLRRDVHRLFDLGYVTITTDYQFRVGDSLRDEFQNGHCYYGLNGQPISLPSHPQSKPQKELLDWHGQQIFKG